MDHKKCVDETYLLDNQWAQNLPVVGSTLEAETRFPGPDPVKIFSASV